MGIILEGLFKFDGLVEADGALKFERLFKSDGSP